MPSTLKVVALISALFAFLYGHFPRPRQDFFFGPWRGEWISHPDETLKKTFFRKRFSASHTLLSLQATFRGEATAALNGISIQKAKEGQWIAQSREAGAGENEILFEVKRKDGNAALIAEILIQNRLIPSGHGWEVSQTREGPYAPCEREGGVGFPSALWPVNKPPWENVVRRNLFWESGALGLFLFLLGAGLRLRLKPREGNSMDKQADRLLPGIAAAAIFIVACSFRIHNGASYPFRRGYDAPGHLEYVQRMSEGGRMPRATEGRLFYHPPLYYFSAGQAYAFFTKHFPGRDPVRALQMLSAIFSCLTLLFVGLCLLKIFPNNSAAAFSGFLAVSLLPADLQAAPLISNEPFTACLCALAFLLLFWKPNPWLLGALSAACALSKYSGIFFAMAAGAFFSVKKRRRVAAIVASLFLLGSGWFYLRNLFEHGRLFVSNMDPGFFPFGQPPGSRDALFFLSFPFQIFSIPFHPHAISSFWGGNFATLWWDYWGFFILKPEALAGLLGSLALLLALFPTSLAVLGFFRILKRAWKMRKPAETALAVMFLSLSAAYALYTVRYPFFSTVKAFYLLPALVPIAAFFGEGFSHLWRRAGIWRAALLTDGTLLAGILGYAFWYGRI